MGRQQTLKHPMPSTAFESLQRRIDRDLGRLLEGVSWLWMQPGVQLMVREKGGNSNDNHTQMARCESSPYLEGNTWMVQIVPVRIVKDNDGTDEGQDTLNDPIPVLDDNAGAVAVLDANGKGNDEVIVESEKEDTIKPTTTTMVVESEKEHTSKPTTTSTTTATAPKETLVEDIGDMQAIECMLCQPMDGFHVANRRETSTEDYTGWIRPRTTMWCKTNKCDHLYQALCVESPFYSIEDGEWLVKIKWDWDKTVEEIPCKNCFSTAAQQPQHHEERRRRFKRKDEASPVMTPPPAKRYSFRRMVSPLGEDEAVTFTASRTSAAATTVPTNLFCTTSLQKTTKFKFSKHEYAKQQLSKLPDVWPDEAEAALKAVGPPYSLQHVMKYIQKQRDQRDATEWEESGVIEPEKGMQIRKMFGGIYYLGKVMHPLEVRTNSGGRKVRAWRVEYEDGDFEDMELGEILRYRVNRSRIPAPCRGRPFQFLELFSGRGVVTQAFFERKWKVQSIDSDFHSNATLKKSILDVDPSVDFDFVPDCVWASPPCHTYSNLGIRAHRSLGRGEYTISAEAHLHDKIFLKLMHLLLWIKRRHPHVIVVIENPVGSLRKMPLMNELERELGLIRARVDYCTFGREEKKPTMLWTNDHSLRSRLSRYNCSEMCPYGNSENGHPVDLQQSLSQFDFSAIPEALAEEVAEYVDSKFCLDNLRQSKTVPPKKPEKPHDDDDDALLERDDEAV